MEQLNDCAKARGKGLHCWDAKEEMADKEEQMKL
jgi:hypothetical protein